MVDTRIIMFIFVSTATERQTLEVLMTALLVSLASEMKLNPVQAIALPAVISSAAKKAGMSEFNMAREALCNKPLRSYLASICNGVDVAEALN